MYKYSITKTTYWCGDSETESYLIDSEILLEEGIEESTPIFGSGIVVETETRLILPSFMYEAQFLVDHDIQSTGLDLPDHGYSTFEGWVSECNLTEGWSEVIDEAKKTNNFSYIEVSEEKVVITFDEYFVKFTNGNCEVSREPFQTVAVEPNADAIKALQKEIDCSPCPARLQAELDRVWGHTPKAKRAEMRAEINIARAKRKELLRKIEELKSES